MRAVRTRRAGRCRPRRRASAASALLALGLAWGAGAETAARAGAAPEPPPAGAPAGPVDARSAPTGPTDPARVLAEARAALAADRPGAAAAALRELALREGVSADLLHDLGRAELEAGRPGPAILALERARWLAPRDAAIADDLAAARGRAGVRAAAPSPGERVLALASPDEWAVLAVAGVAIASLLAVLAVLGRLPRRRGVAVALAAAAGLGVVGAAACLALALRLDRAVVVAPDTVLRRAPFAGAESRGPVPAGGTVRLEGSHGGFVRVSTGEGRAGWIPAAACAAIVPAAESAGACRGPDGT